MKPTYVFERFQILRRVSGKLKIIIKTILAWSAHGQFASGNSFLKDGGGQRVRRAEDDGQVQFIIHNMDYIFILLIFQNFTCGKL